MGSPRLSRPRMWVTCFLRPRTCSTMTLTQGGVPALQSWSPVALVRRYQGSWALENRMAASFLGRHPMGVEAGATSASGGRVASRAAWAALAASAAAALAAASASAAAPGSRGKAGPAPEAAAPRRPPPLPPTPPALRSASGVTERAAASGSSTSMAVRSGASLRPRMDAYSPSTRVDSEGAKRRVRSSLRGATRASLRCSASLIPSLLR
mmetsp:Transcript_20284/g.77897  ORF Transcript_20284/g.77897 Transcript_20284/m.77897 type:complete len:210 (-) Transcript_20284:802-1431(-)